MRWQALLFVPLLLLLVTGSGIAEPTFTALHATRTIMPEYHLDPFDVTVRDTQAVRRLYKAATALPTVPLELSIFAWRILGWSITWIFLLRAFRPCR